MAIFVPGIRCSISGREISSAEEAVLFPAFVANEADPLYIFSDAVIHKEIFDTHPLSASANARLAEVACRALPANRRCRICKKLVENPDDFIGLGHLVAVEDHPLHEWNYACFHRSCLVGWSDRERLVGLLEALDKSGNWRGAGLRRLIKMLRSQTNSDTVT